MRQFSLKKGLFGVFMYAVLFFTVAVSVFPILWVILSSFKTNAQILSNPFTLPQKIDFEPYVSVFYQYDFATFGYNSLLISGMSTVLSLLMYSMGAYVIAKYEFPLKNLFYALFTLTLLVPSHTKAQPIFTIIMGLGLYDTKQGLMLVYLSGGIAMAMFVMKSSFMALPKSLDESAAIEGAGFFRIFWKINLPLVRPGLATVGVMMFLGNWNEYFYAALLTSSAKNRTLPVALSFFNQSFSYDYTRMFAALTMVVVPGILIYMIAQEQVQASLSSGAIKG